MTIRELLVKISAAVDRVTFEKARQAAEKVKDALQQTSAQGQAVSQSFSTVQFTLTNLKRDFSNLTEVLEKHKFVLAGVATAATMITKSTIDSAVNF